MNTLIKHLTHTLIHHTLNQNKAKRFNSDGTFNCLVPEDKNKIRKSMYSSEIFNHQNKVCVIDG